MIRPPMMRDRELRAEGDRLGRRVDGRDADRGHQHADAAMNGQIDWKGMWMPPCASSSLAWIAFSLAISSAWVFSYHQPSRAWTVGMTA